MRKPLAALTITCTVCLLFSFAVPMIQAQDQDGGRYDRAPWSWEHTTTTTVVTTTTERFDAPPDVLGGYISLPTSGSPNYGQLMYRPRAFANGVQTKDPTYPFDTVVDAGSYSGWGILPTWNSGLQRQAKKDDWFRVWTNRPATIGVVVRSGEPRASCLSGLTQSGTVKIQRGKTLFTYPVYNVGVESDYTLCAVNTGTDISSSRDAPLLLIGEANAVAPTAPPVPDLHMEEVPVPNETCPSWIQAESTSIGPDGLTYTGYDYQIDPVYWCYNRHSHGADPYLFDPAYAPALGYQAAKMGMTETHAGYKIVVFDAVYDGRSIRWLFAVHIGTAGVGRICVPIHSMNVAILDLGARQAGASYEDSLLMDARLMFDFGSMKHNDTGVPIRHATCPNQYEDSLARKVPPGVGRKMPVTGGQLGYETWVPWLQKASLFAFNGSFNINTIDTKTACDEAGNGTDTFCDLYHIGYSEGTGLFFQGSLFGPNYSANSTKPTGHFCSDPMGTVLMDCADPMAVEQFVSPSLRGTPIYTNSNRAEDFWSFGDKWEGSGGIGIGALPAIREGSIRPEDGN